MLDLWNINLNRKWKKVVLSNNILNLLAYTGSFLRATKTTLKKIFLTVATPILLQNTNILQYYK